MDKNAGQTLFPLSERELSFDGGSISEGGHGHWYPARLSNEQLDDALLDDGERTMGKKLRLYSAGGRTGQLAAEEYVAYLKKKKSNYYEDEYNMELRDILFDMLGVTKKHVGQRRFAEAICFIDGLFAYLAYGCRNVTAADKKENAKR